MKSFLSGYGPLLAVLVGFAPGAHAAFVYEGTLSKADSTPVTGSVNLRFRIYNPAQTCVLFAEDHVLNITDPQGNFTAQIGGGVRTGGEDSAHPLEAVFANSAGIAGTGGSCIGGNYSPVAGDGRVMKILVNDGFANEILGPIAINEVPRAAVASTLDGKAPSSFLQVRDDAANDLNQSNLENVFTAINFPKLTALLGGTSTMYATSSTGQAVVMPGYGSSPASPQNGSVWYDSTSGKMKFYAAGAEKIFADAGATVVNGGSMSAVTVGTNSMSDLTLIGNSTPAMIVKGVSGNVGFGTTGPTTNFEANYTLSATSGTLAPVYTGAKASGVGSADITGHRINGQILGGAQVNSMSGLEVNSSSQTTSSTPALNGIKATAINTTTGSVTSAVAGVFNTNNQGTGAVGTGHGAKFNVNNASTATMTNAIGSEFSVVNGGGGVINNAYGIKIGNVEGTNRWGLYQTDASANNMFAGKVGIGTGSMPPVGTLQVFASSAPSLYVTNDSSAGAGQAPVLKLVNYQNSLGTAPTLFFSNADGSSSVPTQIGVGQKLGSIAAIGRNSAASAKGAAIDFVTDEVWSGASSAGTSIRFSTALNGSNTATERLQISNLGYVGIGGITPNSPLDVDGAIVSRVKVIPTGAAVNLALANTFVLQAVGGTAITLTNLVNGATYTIIVEDTTSRTYTFPGCTQAFFSPANGATAASSETVYKITVGASGKCYIQWQSGFM